MKALPTSPCAVVLGLALVLPALAAGCDSRPRRVPVSGQVLIDGRPLTSGYVRIVPADARPATGEIDENGRFTLTTFDPDDGCVPGTHGVEVVATEIVNPHEIRRLVPKRYADATRSDLTVTIDGPTDSLLIEVSWEGEKPRVIRDDFSGDVDPAAMQ